MYETLVLAFGTIQSEGIQCIAEMAASWVVRFDARQMLIDADLGTVLLIVGEYLQRNRTMFTRYVSNLSQ